jgi:hypothetical protein
MDAHYVKREPYTERLEWKKERRVKKMKCAIWKQGQTHQALTTVTLVRGYTTVVIKDVPAANCENYSEYYINEDVTDKVQNLA